MLSEHLAINRIQKNDPQKAQALAQALADKKTKASSVDFIVNDKILVETNKTD